MKKTWLTAVSVAGVLGTGSAAVMAGAAMNAGSHSTSDTSALGISLPRSTVYQVGAAARIEVTEAGGVISVISATPTSGWTVTSTSGAGPTATVVLTDGNQIVTFTASMVAGTIHAEVTAALSPAPSIVVVPDSTTAPAVVIQDPGNQASDPNAAQAPVVGPTSNSPITGASTTGASHAGANSKVGTTSQHNDDVDSEDESEESNDD